MTIEEVMALQEANRLGAVHVVYISETRWVVAHTDYERDEGFDALLDCELNDWLEELGGPPEPVGVYAALPDEYEGWELIPLGFHDDWQ